MPDLPAFAKTSSFAFQPTQIVQLRAAHSASSHQIDVIDNRCMDREDTFHALPEAYLADCNRLAHSGVLTGDHRSFEGLQTLLVTLSDPHVNTNRVPWTKLRMRSFAQIFTNKLTDKCVLHDLSSALLRGRRIDRAASVVFSRATQPGANA